MPENFHPTSMYFKTITTLLFFFLIPNLYGQLELFTPNQKQQTNESSQSSNENLAAELKVEAEEHFKNERFAKAAEVLKKAIKLSPEDEAYWILYDHALISEYIFTTTGAIEQENDDDTLAELIFTIKRIDSYSAGDVFHIVGLIENISDVHRRNIEISAILLDEEENELRQEAGIIRLGDYGLLPNESSVFEIQITNPPSDFVKHRVIVTDFE